MENRLPANPKQLLEVGLRDLRAACDNPDVEVDMGTWFAADAERCVVCLAGATLLPLLPADMKLKTAAGSCRVLSPQEWVTWNWVTPRDGRLLQALDYYRLGSLYDALRRPLEHHRGFYADDDGAVGRLAAAWRSAMEERGISSMGTWLQAPTWKTPGLFFAYLQSLILAWDDVPEVHRAKYDELLTKYLEEDSLE